MSTVADNEVENNALHVLGSCDLATMTLKKLRQLLEEQLKIDLSGRKQLLRDVMDSFMATNTDAIAYAASIEAEKAKEIEHVSEPITKKPSNKKGGFGAPVSLSPELADFLGEDVLPRTEVTKKMWAYIRENNLQNPANKRQILCNGPMEALFKRKTLDMFKMTKALSTMMKSVAEIGPYSEIDDALPAEKEVRNSRKRKTSKVQKKVTKKSKLATNSGKQRNSSSSKRGGGKMGSFLVSEKLSSLLEIPRTESRCQVVSKMWEYIKAHDLQNPADKRQILLDTALQNVLGVEKCTMFSINKYIAQHMERVESNGAGND